ncbi:MAG: hypothetical protein ACC628_13405 [Pirellulaceae bacterium]
MATCAMNVVWTVNGLSAAWRLSVQRYAWEVFSYMLLSRDEQQEVPPMITGCVAWTFREAIEEQLADRQQQEMKPSRRKKIK